MMPEAVAACPTCSDREFHAVEPFADGRIATTYSACGRCGLVAMNPRPTAAESAAYYAAEYWTGRAGDDGARRRKQGRQAGFILDFLERRLGRDGGTPLPELSQILEVGSSFGMTLRRVGDRVARLGGAATLYGIEPGEHAVAAAPDAYRHIRLLGRSWEELEGATEPTFDLVIVSHVLEHLDDPVRAAAAVSRRLAPGGALFVEVPNFYGHPSVEYAHNYCFTETSLRNALGRAGLSVAALEVNGHDEDFPFYLTCLAVPGSAGFAMRPESVAEVRARRRAGVAAFHDLRRRQPRPA